MIEGLKGTFEDIQYKDNTKLRLYDNDKFEDYPPHWHTTMELIMPTKNYYNVEIQGEEIHLKENDIIIMPPGCVHTLTHPREGGRRIIFQPDISQLRNMKEFELIMSTISPVMIITPENQPEIHSELCKLLLAIRDEYLSESRFSELSIYSKFLDILVNIGRYYIDQQPQFTVSATKQQEYIDKFLQICEYISDHCSEDLTLEDVAELSGFSKFYFTRLFKQFTNTTFYKYLNQKRITKAENLLIDPQNSVTDVALNSGFSSISSFIRMFKIIKGCTPTEFREKYTRNEESNL